MTAPPVDETVEMTVRQALNEAIKEEMARDDSVFYMGEDVGREGGVFGKTEGIKREFGEKRVIDTPISEAGFVGSGLGAAMTGLRPVVEIMFHTFIGAAGDQILNQIPKLRYMLDGQVDIPLTIMTQEALGRSGAAQHSGALHTWFSHMPGYKVVAPGTAAGIKGLAKASIRSDDPVIFCENMLMYNQSGDVPVGDDFVLPIGEGRVVRAGDAVTVVATQRYVQIADAIAGEYGNQVEVIDPQTLYPLDTDTILESVRKTGRLVVIDESWLSYGFHAEVVSRVVENVMAEMVAPVQRLGVPDTNIPFAPTLEKEITPNEADIKRAIDTVLEYS